MVVIQMRGTALTFLTILQGLSHAPAPSAVNEARLNEAALCTNPGNSAFYLEPIHTGNIDISKLKLSTMYGGQVKFTCEVKRDCIKIDPDPNLAGGYYLLQYCVSQKKVEHNLFITGNTGKRFLWLLVKPAACFVLCN